MKNFYLYICVICTNLISCVNYNDSTSAINVSVRLVQPSNITNQMDLSGKNVSLSVNGSTITQLTDQNGVATFNNIVPDVYNIATTWKITNDEYRNYTGDNVVISGAQITGTLSQQNVFNNNEISLPTNISIDRDLVIGKINASTLRDNNNRNLQTAKYIELYNQSEKEVDVSGLYIGLVESNNNPAYSLANLNSQYADSVVMLKQVFRIPTTANFRVAPGATVLIVNSAINHNANASNADDLSKADFEAKDASGRISNNADVPALELIYTTNASLTNMNLVQGGPCGVVIFRTDADVNSFGKPYAFGRTSGIQYLALPIRYVIDGVEYLKNNSRNGVDISSKRVLPAIDASYTNVTTTNGNTGEIVYRKTASTQNGRIILQDTNNSSDDFKVSTTIKIRNYDN